ncbi:hypothetical protein INT44_004723 [Umbelopsis vinacea]|uniref:Sulphur transport domain-containing protein n=1 Tax=Umbelopsis vinacea TaxID=44442 RepID=A0A8H7PFG8_9FUNG|nr:hypothetical protein INT44_004723 [Umbelopsis vinacea]
MDTLKSTSAGMVFGAALTLSRVYVPTVIINQLRLRDFHMLEVFLTASASSALIMLGFEKFGIAKRSVRTNSSLGWFSYYDGNIIGGSLLGVGMGLTGACPGTVLPQLAQGIESAPWTTLGAVLGGAMYAKFGKSLVFSSHSSKDEDPIDLNNHTISSKFNASPSATFLTFEGLVITTTALSALLLPGKTFAILPTVVGGLLIGAAQVASITLTSSPLGVSNAYQQLGSYLCRAIGFEDVPRPPFPPKSILFALGILIGSAVSGPLLPKLANAGVVPISNIQAMIGGFILVLGARIAGGCTSGHGISGLSAMSFSSLITTAAMFGAGIVTQLILK